MIGNLIGLLVLLVLVVLFGYLAKRAWGTKRGVVVKWGGVVLSGLLMLLLALVFVVALVGYVKTTTPSSNPVSNVKMQGTPEQIARGATLAYACSGCHASAGQPPLDGSKENLAQIPNGPTLGSIYAPNLTPAGETAGWSDGEVIRAIREGVHKSGRPLIIMPTQAFHSMSDPDVQAIVVYLRSQPATKNKAENDTPSNSANLLGLIMLGAGMFDTSVQSPITQPIPAPPPGANVENGKYLATVLGCADCHGKDYKGGTPGGFAPAGPNIVAIASQWSDADFGKFFRTGTDPSGRTVSDQMPWKDYTKFSDDEFKAVYMYLRTLK